MPHIHMPRPLPFTSLFWSRRERIAKTFFIAENQKKKLNLVIRSSSFWWNILVYNIFWKKVQKKVDFNGYSCLTSPEETKKIRHTHIHKKNAKRMCAGRGRGSQAKENKEKEVKKMWNVKGSTHDFQSKILMFYQKSFYSFRLFALDVLSPFFPDRMAAECM